MRVFIFQNLRRLYNWLHLAKHVANYPHYLFLGKKRIFHSHYHSNAWGSDESISGVGSTRENTSSIRAKLPELFKAFHIKKIIDIPCGDFNWIKLIDLSKFHYLGGDIIEELVDLNNEKYKKSNISFEIIDVLKDPIPEGDLLICRDLLVHFSFSDIKLFIRKLKNSRVTFLLTTSFLTTDFNKDIITGMWRPINLEIYPFNFPKSDFVILEDVNEAPQYKGSKSLCLYKISDLPEL